MKLILKVVSVETVIETLAYIYGFPDVVAHKVVGQQSPVTTSVGGSLVLHKITNCFSQIMSSSPVDMTMNAHTPVSHTDRAHRYVSNKSKPRFLL